MRLHERFEWDPAKAAANAADNGVTFERAVRALSDEYGDCYHVDAFQEVRGEDRWLTYASNPFNRGVVYAIVWTERVYGDMTVTRIISARYADAQEQRDYENKVFTR